MTPKRRQCVGVYITALPSLTHLLGLKWKCNKVVQNIFLFCGSLVIKKKRNYWKYIEKPDCQKKWLPQGTNQNWVICWGSWLQAFTWTHKKQSWGSRKRGEGGLREKLPLSLWITFVCLCMCIHRPDCWPEELAGLWSCPQQQVSKKRGVGG